MALWHAREQLAESFPLLKSVYKENKSVSFCISLNTVTHVRLYKTDNSQEQNKQHE